VGTVSSVGGTHQLDEHQQRAVDTPAGPVAILAGPGSGKTATLVSRIARLCADGEIDAERSLALCHTTKAAGELAGRLSRTEGRRVACSTIHAAAWRQVRRWWTRAGLAGEPVLQAGTYPLVRRAAEHVLGKVEPGTVSDLASEIDWARAALITRENYPVKAARAGRDCGIKSSDITKVWERYEALKTDSGVFDFADVLETAWWMTTASPAAGELAGCIDALFVDEYQDVDAAQQRLIEAWLGDGNNRLCVVGDVDQAIYQFKGGDPQFLERFAARWPGATVISLIDNYRSSPQVVSWVNQLASTGRATLIGRGGDGPSPKVHEASNETAEERALVHQLNAWHDTGVSFDEMAVLYRFNATAARLESALLDAGIPHHVAGQGRFFDRDEIRAVLVPFGQKARATPDADGLELLVDTASEQGFDLGAPPAGAGTARQRWEAVSALVALVSDQLGGLAAGHVLSDLQQRAMSSHDLTPGGVTLGTVHAAKGLEWDAVWVVGLVEGQMPSSFATTRTELDEERRIVYVAVSRARAHLVVSWAGRRHNNWSDKPSRYLDLLGGARPLTVAGKHPKATSGTTVGGRRPDGRAIGECVKCGGRLTSTEARKAKRCSGGCLDGKARERYDQLVAWRDANAQQLGCAPPRVASDRSLFRAAVAGASKGIPGFSASGGRPPL
jgi:DNA helicase-2/ATP-dependent DNA helicase PcrA